MNRQAFFSSRATTRNIGALLVGSLLLVGCSMPQFGAQEPTPVPFEVTPYATDGEAAVEDESSQAATNENNGTESPDTGPGTGPDTGPDTEPANEPDTEPATVSAPSGESIIYKGEILPRDRLVVVSETNGMVETVNIDVGEMVMAGDVLALVDSAILEAQRAQALAGLEAAQAQLDLIQEEASEEDLEAARAGVSAASAAYRRALDGPTAEDERMALAQLRQAEAAVTVAQAGYNRVKGNPFIGMLPESLQLQQATLQLEAAQAQYDKLLIGSTEDIIAGAYAQLAQARAQLERLEEGAKDAQVQAAVAQVKQAETALYLAHLQLDKATITSPIDGIVSMVNTTQGAMVAPGSPIAQLLSEEVDVVVAVEEYLLSQIKLGAPAQIIVNAYPDRVFEGEIALIAPELDPSTRTVQVTVRPIGDAAELAPGMFATVDFSR